MLLTIFLTSFVIALSGALMPGPLFAATISEGARRGFVVGPLLILGHGLLELALLLALLLGLAPYLQQDEVVGGIAIAGAVFLLWTAVSMLRSLPGLQFPCERHGSGGNRLIWTGVLLSLANPYWTIWWVTIGLGYIVQATRFGAWGVIVFFAGHILADLVWYGAVAAAVGNNGRRLISDRLYRGIIACCAGLLFVFACWFASVGVTRMIV